MLTLILDAKAIPTRANGSMTVCIKIDDKIVNTGVYPDFGDIGFYRDYDVYENDTDNYIYIGADSFTKSFVKLIKVDDFLKLYNKLIEKN